MFAANESSSLSSVIADCTVPEDRLAKESDATDPVSSRLNTGPGKTSEVYIYVLYIAIPHLPLRKGSRKDVDAMLN